MSKFISLVIIGITALLQGCAVVPARVVYSGGVEVRSTGGYYYPPVQHSPYRDTRIQTKEDEQGLLSFRVSQGGLSEPEVDWILRRVEGLKAQCPNGGEMKKYEILSAERANPYAQSRSSRGDTTVRIEYVCSREAAPKAPPRAPRSSAPPASAPTMPGKVSG